MACFHFTLQSQSCHSIKIYVFGKLTASRKKLAIPQEYAPKLQTIITSQNFNLTHIDNIFWKKKARNVLEKLSYHWLWCSVIDEAFEHGENNIDLLGCLTKLCQLWFSSYDRKHCFPSCSVIFVLEKRESASMLSTLLIHNWSSSQLFSKSLIWKFSEIVETILYFPHGLPWPGMER